MAFIAYSKPKNGVIYATVVESIRHGKKIKQRRIENLGKVIDSDSGIFQNRKRGIFQYTLKDGFSSVDSSMFIKSHKPEVIEKEKLILDFGDSFVLDKYLHTLPFYNACHCAMPSGSDTLFSLLFYRILAEKKAYCYADTWWSGNYAGILSPPPEAKLHSQRVSEFLAALEREEAQRRPPQWHAGLFPLLPWEHCGCQYALYHNGRAVTV